MTKNVNSEYDSALLGYRLAFGRGGGYTAITLILMAVALDYALYPKYQLLFGLARVFCTLLMFGIILLMNTGWGQRQVQWLTFGWLILPQIMIAWMISYTEGAQSIYVAGLNIAIFASGIALPSSIWQNISLSVLTVLLYILACWYHPSGVAWHGAFLVNTILLVLIGIATAVCTAFNEQARHMLFQLKAELAEKNILQEVTNKDLAEIKGQMLQQEKMAAIGTLSAGLMHEINNPVNYCLMAIDVALEEPAIKASPVLLECLGDAKQGMRRIQHIVSDLKTFAYRDQKSGGHATYFLFSKALETAVRFTGYELKGAVVTQDLPKETLVAGDEGAIVGVLINLLNNAVLAMRNAGRTDLTIHVSAKWMGNRLRIIVRDNGPGILPENLTRVFEPFFTTRDVGQGLGLGLSISYRVIEQHGSTLMAESLVGEWTKMIFDLPRAESGEL